jgi:hypothetical protein
VGGYYSKKRKSQCEKEKGGPLVSRERERERESQYEKEWKGTLIRRGRVNGRRSVGRCSGEGGGV